ncbi:MAG: hypothetical protein JSW73_04865 [Candidatus Woesearchaeota archaeon]|nr:MAG: hypothetical protein JSW73_04865 [Candidatus Woesearchaeota archaeon]
MVEIRLGKKGFDTAAIVIVAVIIILGVLSLILVYSTTSSPFKETGIKLSEKSEEYANVSFGNLTLDPSLYMGRPYDECGNKRGVSSQDVRFDEVTFIGLTVYPEYYECVGYDCCRGFVYEHILDMGKEYTDKFLHIDYYLQNTFEVDSFAKGCTGDECCQFDTVYTGVTIGDIVYCKYPEPYIFLFYYSATGKEADWHKFYHTRYYTPPDPPGKQELILPIGDEFRFIKVITLNSYLDYINGEVIPWKYPGKRYITVCNKYHPDIEGTNHLYNPDGDDIILLDPLEGGNGYILNMSTEGIWDG